MRLIPNAEVGGTHPRGWRLGEIVQNANGAELAWNGTHWTAIEEHLEPEEEPLGMRFNTGKTRFDLIPQSWIRSLAQILTVGAAKYEPRNWEKGLSYSETLGSLHRHLNSWLSGERYDKETKCHHLGHVAWNALALMTMELRGIGKDDLPVDDDETMEK